MPHCNCPIMALEFFPGMKSSTRLITDESSGVKSTVPELFVRLLRKVKLPPPLPPPAQDQAPFTYMAIAPEPPAAHAVLCVQFEQYRIAPLPALPRLANVELPTCAALPSVRLVADKLPVWVLSLITAITALLCGNCGAHPATCTVGTGSEV